MTNETQESGLITQSQIQEVAVNGAAILQKSELRVSKALSVGESILQAINEGEMTPELDERANKFLVNCRGAKTDIENERKPITALFDMVRKQFTTIEGHLDVKAAGGVPARIQAHRDAYVKKLRDAELEKQRIAQAKLDKDNEVIEIKASIETQLSTYVQNHIAERKTKLLNSFNGITLETYEEKAKALKALAIKYDKVHFDSFSPVFAYKHNTKEEYIAILTALLDSKDFTLISAVVVDDLDKYKKELIEKLPSLKTSLDEMAKANEQEAKRLAEEKRLREEGEAAKITEDAATKITEEAQAVEVNKVADQTNAMMENLAVVDTVVPETRDGYKITVVNKAGFAEIFTFWFQREGMTLSNDEIEKKSIAQMKAYCEKLAHKSNELIVSDNLKYEPVYKAVNRK